MPTFLYGLNRHMALLSAVSRSLVHMLRFLELEKRLHRQSCLKRCDFFDPYFFVFVWIGYISSFAACSQHSSGMFGQLHSPNLSLHNVMALAKTVPCDILPVRNKFSDILHQ